MVNYRQRVCISLYPPFSLILSNPVLAYNFSGCGEIGPLKDASYTASTAVQPARLARLNTSHPGASQDAWCPNPEDIDVYLQIDLGVSG